MCDQTGHPDPTFYRIVCTIPSNPGEATLNITVNVTDVNGVVVESRTNITVEFVYVGPVTVDPVNGAEDASCNCKTTSPFSILEPGCTTIQCALDNAVVSGRM